MLYSALMYHGINPREQEKIMTDGHAPPQTDTELDIVAAAPTDQHTPLTPLAYSETVELPYLHQRRRWPAILCAGAAVAALTAVGAAWLTTHHPGAPTQAPPPVAPTAPPAPAPTPPAPPPNVPDAMPKADEDSIFLSKLIETGIVIVDKDNVIHDAHTICALLADGHTQTELTPAIQGVNPTLSSTQVQTMINTSRAVYCPGQ
jgi:hypothetical protein